MIRGIHSFLMRRTYGALFVRTMALLLALSAGRSVESSLTCLL